MNLKTKLSALAAGVASYLSLASSAFATTNLIDNVGIRTDGPLNSLQNIRPSNFIAAIINLILTGAGVIAFIFLLWGGLQWILAGGDKEGTEKARKKITSSLIGLAIVFSAYALIFIVQALFGVSIITVTLQNITNYNSF